MYSSAMIVQLWLTVLIGQNIITPAVSGDTVVDTGRCSAAYCDPSHLPYPNMNAALYGYDLIKADPFSTAHLGGDPGWRNPLFFATVGEEKDKGAVKLHPSVEGRDVLQCASEFKETKVTNMKKYKEEQLKSMSTGYDLKIGNEMEVTMGVSVPVKAAEVSAEAKTTIPPFMTRSSSNTESQSKVSGFFEKEGGSMMELIAACSVSVINIIPNVVPLFNEGFARAIGKLGAAKTESMRKSAFQDFYNQYGTHYSKATTMGSKLVYSMRVTLSERADNDVTQISECANVQGLKVFGVQVEENSNKCKDENKFKSSLSSNYVARESHASFGSKPASTMANWAKQEFDKPMPLYMQLVPLPNLFTEPNLQAVSKITNEPINQKELLDWYLPMWEKFCETMGMDCKSPGKGCGYDDTCTWAEKCVPTNNEKGYECQPNVKTTTSTTTTTTTTTTTKPCYHDGQYIPAGYGCDTCCPGLHCQKHTFGEWQCRKTECINAGGYIPTGMDCNVCCPNLRCDKPWIGNWRCVV